MPQRAVIIFSAQWAFSIFERNIYTNFTNSLHEEWTHLYFYFFAVTEFRKPRRSQVASRGLFAPHMGTVAPLKDEYFNPLAWLLKFLEPSGPLQACNGTSLPLHIVGRVAYGYWLCNYRIGSNPGGGEIFRTCPDRPCGPPSFLYNGYRAFPGDKERPERDVDPSPVSSAVVKKE